MPSVDALPLTLRCECSRWGPTALPSVPVSGQPRFGNGTGFPAPRPWWELFDYSSRIERKNPVGLIEAWKRAFPVADRTEQMLFCKTLNGTTARDQRAVVEAAVGDRTDVTVFDAQLAPDDRDRLMDQFDIVASLHRSEGYGLTLLDAMYRGIPVIATTYSGNLATPGRCGWCAT